MSSKKARVERDSMGSVPVPHEAYYGASTGRAVANFPISGLRLQRSFIRALALIKSCAALVNERQGKLKPQLAAAIKRAADETARGNFDAHFVVDVFQTGSGTSTNMNANEVIANRAIELLGSQKGDRSLVHPNDHVNLGMSSNDAIPTATHVAAIIDLSEKLLPALRRLEDALQLKAVAFDQVIKTGRTHLQDATPIRLGQEFFGYAGQIARARARLLEARKRLAEVALGGTAVGTGLNTSPTFARDVLKELSKRIRIKLRETDNHFQAQSTLDEVVFCSAAIKTVAVSLLKIANDIRWLGSGPRAGLAEISLPEVQPGSSIMPGKVNPVIPEAVCQVCAQVIGNDATITIAGQSGNFELNVMQPVAAYNLLQSINLLANVADVFGEKCIGGLEATDRGPQSVESGLGLCTALVPAIGYDLAAAIAHEASVSGETIRQVARRMTSLPEETLRTLLDPFRMTAPDVTDSAKPGKASSAAESAEPKSAAATAATVLNLADAAGSVLSHSDAAAVVEAANSVEQGSAAGDQGLLESAICDWESEGGGGFPAD